jgi:hypothetical protein
MRTHCGAAGILTLYVYHTLRYKTHHKETIAKIRRLSPPIVADQLSHSQFKASE